MILLVPDLLLPLSTSLERTTSTPSGLTCCAKDGTTLVLLVGSVPLPPLLYPLSFKSFYVDHVIESQLP